MTTTGWQVPGARALWGAIVSIALVTTGLVAVTAPAQADTAPPAGTPATVSADALPTWQINGVVWAQTIVGSTVYAVGNFTSARPPGSPLGTNEVPASYLFAYDITTGNPVAFSHQLNAQAKSVAASPDGTKLYVGGDFTTVDGQARNHIAAFDLTTGSLSSTWVPTVSNTVNTIVATSTVVYIGGAFGNVSGYGRSGMAAINATTGAVKAFAPQKDGYAVQTMVLSPDATRVIVGGMFTTVNGAPAPGMASVDAVTGASLPWAANTIIKNSGSTAGIDSLTTDGTYIFGAGWKFGSVGNFEGTFAADPTTGNLVWVNDCHGDTYSLATTGKVLYVAGHAHTCEWMGAFKQTLPNWSFKRAFAVTTYATGMGTGPDDYGWNYSAYATSQMLDWFPTLEAGTFTGQSQAAWSVAANANYVVLGGEFPSVNGTPQQGLVRLAIPSIAPNKNQPATVGFQAASPVSLAPGTVRVSFTTTWDKDNENLTYKVYRDAETAPVFTTTQSSLQWKRKELSFVDTVPAGTTHTYRLTATDPFGNIASAPVSEPVTVLSGALGQYAQDVLGDGATNYWRLGEATSATSADWAGTAQMSTGAGLVRGAGGALNGDSDLATTFDGTATGATTTTTVEVPGPQTFSVEAWFKTTTTTGGKILGFGNGSTGNSTAFDRHIYMTNSGQLIFGVVANSAKSIATSPKAYNDGAYHHVVATLSPVMGIQLFVDGQRVAYNLAGKSAQVYDGYWKIGQDSLTSWSSIPSTTAFNGTIDDVAVYPAPLTLSQVRKHYADSGRVAYTAPSDSYGAAVNAASPDVYWRLDESAGPIARDASAAAHDGFYTGTPTFKSSSNVSGATGSSVTFSATSNGITAFDPAPAPAVYTEMAWINTSSTSRKILGYGSAPTGNSSTYDRQLRVDSNGRIAFSVLSGGSTVTITSPLAYNDSKWHQVAATQGADGMKLYVDSALVASGATTDAAAYTGFWRAASDNANFVGKLDEIALWSSTALTAQQIRAIYVASPAATGVTNALPTASASIACTSLSCTFDGSASSDSDGVISAYAWNFGDGSTATGATAAHSYAASGTYSVTLTVTDNQGGTGTTTKSLTVTQASNVPPTAAIGTPSCTYLTCTFSGAGSSDSDGSIVSYAWDFGDSTTGSGATPAHTFAAAGTYTVTLTVTDDRGGSASTTASVTVSSNQAPTATIAAPSCLGLTCSLNGSSSSDADGTIASYAWDFGDSTTGTGATATHAYAAPGTYTVTLTVTDNAGATASTSATVSPVQLWAVDDYTRTLASGWGTATLGGSWTSNSSTSFSVNGTAGLMTMKTAGAGPNNYLNAVSATSTDTTLTVATDKAATGGGIYVYVVGRRLAGTGDYRAKLHFINTGAVGLSLSFTGSTGAETSLKSEVALAGLVYTPGQQLQVRVQVTGTAPTTVRAKAWPVGAAEPATWTVTATDATAALQAPGAIGLAGYLSTTATNAPVTVTIDGYRSAPVG